jgi:hypothetical protein
MSPAAGCEELFGSYDFGWDDYDYAYDDGYAECQLCI